MPFTPRLNLPFPELDDTANVPADMEEIALAVENLLLGGNSLIGLDSGDIKFSARDVDHGRWIRMDGRELDQAEIEDALGIPDGEAAEFVGVMGTGAVTKFAAAKGSAVTAGKVFLPDTRRQMPVAAGGVGDGPGQFSERDLGERGGVETVILTSQQSGIRAHAHTATDSGHTHSATGGGVNHTHGITEPNGGLGHTHKLARSSNLSNTSVGFTPMMNTADPVDSIVIVQAQPTGITLGQAGAGGSLAIQSGTANITVAQANAADAQDAHDNMPPYIVLGYLFIRV